MADAINVGMKVRITGQTGANIDSSRSHAILQIRLKDTKDLGKFSSSTWLVMREVPIQLTRINRPEWMVLKSTRACLP
jgi:hypothetical protein